MIPLADLAVRFLNRPLLLDERDAQMLSTMVEGWLVPAALANREKGEPLTSDARSLTDRVGRRYDDSNSQMFDRAGDGSVAVIPITGSLVHKGSAAGHFGRTSYEFITAAATRAARDRTVGGIVFEVDSFGGEVSGAFEAADVLRRISIEKPTMSILTDHALSAGYLLASAARTIVIPETGSAGSIGVVTLHADISKMLENVGVKISVLSAGALKAQGNMFSALDDDARDAILARLEASRQVFANTVGRNRGTRFMAEQALATEAGYYGGADAVTIGLADAVGHPSDALDEFVRFIGATRA